MSTTDAIYLPIPVSDMDVVFGDKAMEILPSVSAIPEEFYSYSNQWSRFVSGWFFGGYRTTIRWAQIEFARCVEAAHGIGIKKGASNAS